MEMNMTNILWFLAFVLLAGGNGFGGLFGNNRIPMGPPPATQQDLNAQSMMSELNALGLATANNNYETARLIQDQTMAMQSQNNTNLINAIQGFNSVIQQMQNQYAGIQQQISQLGFQMDQCCSKIQTQMLQDRLTDKTAEVVALQAKLDNQEQTRNILASLGRFVPWAGSGSVAGTVTTGA